MCANKDGSCACGCENNTEFVNDKRKWTVYDSNVEPLDFTVEDKKLDKDPEKEEDVIIVDGVEYVRKNKKQLIEEPVILDKDDKVLLNE